MHDRIRIGAWRATALVVLAAACADPAGGGRDALLDADREARTLLNALADDAYLLVPNRALLVGPDAAALLERELPEGRVERTPLLVGLSSDGRHGYTAGRVVERALRGEGDLHGKYLAYWRWDQGDRRWRIAAYVTNPSLPVPDSVSPEARRAHESPPRASGGRKRDVAELTEADAAFSARAAEAGAGPAFREYAEPHALALLAAGRGMIWGDSAIGAYFAAAIPASDRLTWTPRVAELAPSGDLGFTIGDATYRAAAAGGAVALSFTKYLTVWRRQPDGRWRYAADGGNAQPGPEPPP